MKAFVNTEMSKPELLARVRAHAAADEIVKGEYWENGKGCAVGCSIYSSNHSLYEPMFGIPQVLARLEDTIFEGLPLADAKDWPIRFVQSINPGADLGKVVWEFLHWLLTEPKVNPGIEHPMVRESVARCAAVVALMRDGESAAESARSAADSAESAAWSAKSAESAAFMAMAEKLVHLCENTV